MLVKEAMNPGIYWAHRLFKIIAILLTTYDFLSRNT